MDRPLYHYDNFFLLSTEEIHKKISKLNQMIEFYRLVNSEGYVKELADMLETCYFIINERMELDFLEEYLPEDGIVIDTTPKEETFENNPKEAKRKRGPRRFS